MDNFVLVLLLWLIFAFFGKDAITSMLYLIQDAEISSKIRGYIEVRYTGTKLEYLINCPYCLSYWIGLFLTIMYIGVCFYLQIHWIVSLTLGVFLYLTMIGRKIVELRKMEH
jgi:hypothetical protein